MLAVDPKTFATWNHLWGEEVEPPNNPQVVIMDEYLFLVIIFPFFSRSI